MTGPYRFLIPLGLAAVAAGANFLVISRMAAKVEVVVAAADIPLGTRVGPEMLKTIAVKADPGLFPTAFRTTQLGLLVDKPVRRALKAGEIVFRADIEEDDNPILPLAVGEESRTLIVKVDRVSPLLRPGEQAVVLLQAGTLASAESADAPADQLGPYRFLGSVLADGEREAVRKVILAVPAGDIGVRQFLNAVGNAHARTEKIQAVEQSAAPTAAGGQGR